MLNTHVPGAQALNRQRIYKISLSLEHVCPGLLYSRSHARSHTAPLYSLNGAIFYNRESTPTVMIVLSL